MAQYDKLINLGLLSQFLTKAKTIFAPKITASGILKGDGTGGVSAATAGTDYATPAQSLSLGLTGASVGDLVRVNAVDANGKPTSWKKVALNEIKCNKNLLDNWYFVGGGSQLGDGVFPINQRGQTTYSSDGYVIDRWQSLNSASLELGVNGIKYTRTIASNYPRIQQKITNVKAGMTITVSVLVRSHLEKTGNYIMLRLMADSNIAMMIKIDKSYSDWRLITGHLTTTADITDVRFQFSNPSETSSVGDWIEIAAVKLELGSEQTLAHNEGTEENPVWVLNEIPDYGEELRKCQRYYYKHVKSNQIITTNASGKSIGLELQLPFAMPNASVTLETLPDWIRTKENQYNNISLSDLRKSSMSTSNPLIEFNVSPTLDGLTVGYASNISLIFSAEP